MGEVLVFRPRHRPGLIFNITATLILVFLSSTGTLRFFQVGLNSSYLWYLLPALVALLLLPAILYRFYALQNATYLLERDGMRLRWGLRSEDIPMDHILWVHAASEVSGTLPKPWLRWSGAVLGKRSLADGKSIEYMASSTKNMVLIATFDHYFAITPANPRDFLQAFQHFIEMGSLTPLEAHSVFPTFLINRVWAAVPARLMIVTGIVISLALVTTVVLAIPSHPQIHLGFRPDQTPGDLLPSPRLLLLPILNAIFFMIDLLSGLFFFRRNKSQPIAYILWGFGAITPALFLIAVIFILGIK